VLEKIGTPEFSTLSRPQYTTIGNIKKLLVSEPQPRVAEIGVGIGATSKGICEVLENRGELHIFDFQDKVTELQADLAALGYRNVVAHGNTERYWDSYHWSLAKLCLELHEPFFDYVYLDAHTLLHDTPALFLAEKLLKVGGTLDLDDYDWTFASSRSMKSVRHRYMTEEQEAAKQVKMLVELFVAQNPLFEPLVPNRIYRKRALDIRVVG
jgi:predicted O-methyltransferase YrrM